MSKPYSFSVHLQESDDGFWAVGHFQNHNDPSLSERKKKAWTDADGLTKVMNQIETWLQGKIDEATSTT